MPMFITCDVLFHIFGLDYEMDVFDHLLSLYPTMFSPIYELPCISPHFVLFISHGMTDVYVLKLVSKCSYDFQVFDDFIYSTRHRV